MAKTRGRKSTRSAAKADSEATPKATGDRLVGSVWHNGKNFDPKKASDQAAFKKLVEEEKKLGDKDKKTGAPRAQLDLQRLADEGVISGFGTKASTKRGRKAKDAEVELDAEEGDSEAGGGVDAVEEQEAMEDEQEDE